MHKIYGIIQGEREIDLSGALPGVAQPGTRGKIAYYMWCIKNGNTTVLIDTGMDDEEARKRNIKDQSYIEGQLRRIGVDPPNVETVIITHLHADHFSAHKLYPKASFYIQKKDIEFFTGPWTRFRQTTQTVADIPEVVRLAYANRVRYLDGDAQIAPGIRVIAAGGHTPGLQAVVVTTTKGEVVICGDAVARYRNLEKGVIGLAMNMLDGLASMEKIKAAASAPELVIPGHDPLVMQRFPNPSEGIVEIG